MITDDDFNKAIDRIARTADGSTLYLYCQKRLMAISTADTDGALRSDHGERTFAARLIGLMAKGIQESGGRSTDTSSGDGTGSGDKPIVFALAQPRRVSGARGPGRRTGPDSIVPGWNDSKPDGDE